MSRACRSLVGAIILILVATSVFPQQATTQSDRKLVEAAKLLDVKVGRFVGYGNDFEDYSRSTSGSAQFLVLHFLQDEAVRAATAMQATQIMLLLYTYTFFHPARADARVMVQARLDYYVEGLGDSIARVNGLVTRIQNPAIVNSASRMRDDLRETIDLLKSIKLP